MAYKFKFTTPIQNIMKRSSGLSEVKCETCKQYLTNAQLSYSMRVYGKPFVELVKALNIIEEDGLKTERG